MRRVASFWITLAFTGLMMLSLPALAEEKAKEGEAAAPDFEYVEMDPLSLPIITNRGLTQQLSVIVSLEIDYGKKEEYSVYKPRLADAYLQDLYGALAAGHGLVVNGGGIVDVTKIKERLSTVTNKVLGPDLKVRDVLLQVIQQRPL